MKASPKIRAKQLTLKRMGQKQQSHKRMLKPGNRRHGRSLHAIVLLTLWNFLKQPKFTMISLKDMNFWQTPRITDVLKENSVILPDGQAYVQICHSTKDTVIRSPMSLWGEATKIYKMQQIYKVGSIVQQWRAEI